MEIGDHIKEVRLSLGLTQQQLAEKSGVAAITIRQYESKKRVPRVEQLSKLARAMGVSLSYLCTGQEKSNRYVYQALHPSFDPKSIPKDLEKLRLNLEQNNADSYKVIAFALDQLNQEGRNKAVERVQELTEIPRYRADGPGQGQQQPAGPEADKDPDNE